MTQREMFEKSFERPKNYFNLTPERQWEIDKALGILDWDGTNLSKQDLERYYKHYSLAFFSGTELIMKRKNSKKTSQGPHDYTGLMQNSHEQRRKEPVPFSKDNLNVILKKSRIDPPTTPEQWKETERLMKEIFEDYELYQATADGGDNDLSIVD